MFYFAYGSNMNSERMTTRKTDFEFRGMAMLKEYTLSFNKVAGGTTTYSSTESIYPKTYNLPKSKEFETGEASVLTEYIKKRGCYLPAKKGYANVIPCAGGVVEGALYIVPPDAFKELDKYEGHPTHYKRQCVTVELPNGVEVKAVTYIACADKVAENLFPDEEYLGHLLKGVDILSEGYFRELSSQQTIEVVNPSYNKTSTYNYNAGNYGGNGRSGGGTARTSANNYNDPYYGAY